MPERVPARFALVQDPPFALEGVSTLLFAVRCDRVALERMLDRTFGWAAPGVRLGPLGDHCLIVLTDVARATARDAALGHFSYREASVFVPVWGHRDGHPFAAMHVPFMYPTAGLALAAGREIYGLPKKPAEVDLPETEAFWRGEAAATVRVLGASRFDGQAWTEQELLRVSATAQSPATRAVNELLAAVDDAVGPFPGELAGLSHVFEKDLVQLKQVPDVSPGGVPPRVAYRAVTRIPAPLRAVRDVRLADPASVTIQVAELASEPVCDVLGLDEQVEPTVAASLSMDFGFDEGEVWLEEPERRRTEPDKTRVLILGGGMGALATAHTLTDTEQRRATYDVRVLVQGHLLGGKAANWRRDDRGQRIEEHGLHVIFGFYHNFLRMFRSVYREAARSDDVTPSTFEDAFTPRQRVVFHDGEDHYEVRFPSTPEGHGAGPKSVEDQLSAAWALLEQVIGGSLTEMLAGAFFPDWANRVAGEVLAFAAVLLKGVHEDVVLGGHTWQDLDQWDFREWMHEHTPWGFSDLGDTAVMQVPYDGVFAYQGSDQPTPRLSAGIAARGLLELAADYEEAVFYEMTAGMGEAVFAPLYEVLRDRGVKFEFFAKVTELDVAGGRARSVRYTRQAEVSAGRLAYQPLARRARARVWRRDPDLAQLERPAPVEDHDPYSDADDARVADETLQVHRDFDWVVCALPAPVTAHVLGDHDGHELLSAIARIPTVATLHLQTWFDDDLDALGWPWTAGLLGGFRQPLNSIQQNTRLLDVEGWADDAPASLLYASGPFAAGWATDSTDPDARRDAEDRAHRAARQFVRAEYGRLLGSDEGDDEPEPFDLARLHAPWNPDDPMADQYVRANIDRSARYVLIAPGGLADRPHPAPSELVNLRFAGDWTHNGVDIPSIEGAVVSGLQAAASILGTEPDIL